MAKGNAIRAKRIRPGPRALASLVIPLGAVFLMLLPAQASADATCSYNGATKTVTVAGSPKFETNLGVADDGEIFMSQRYPQGTFSIDCSGGTPTTTNTDTIDVNLLSPDENTTLAIINPEEFGPGVFNETGTGGVDCPDEIEIDVSLGSGHDVVELVGSDGGDDNLVLGSVGVDRDPIGSALCSDLDIAAANEDYEVDAGGLVAGPDTNTVSAQGSGATGLPLPAPLVYSGGPGVDQVTGGDAADDLDGGAGADILRGGNGNDQITGGPGGQDRLFGEAGEDWLFAEDGKADVKINCGEGAKVNEFAVTDPSKDAKPKSC